MAKSRKDLLLAKRRVLAMLPFICINFSFAIIMLVFSAIAYYRVYKINDDYLIQPYHYIGNAKNSDCLDRIKKINEFSYNSNFTQIFDLDKDHGKNDVTLEKFIDSISVGFAFSITAVLFLTIFLIMSIVFYFKYVIPSDEVIKANPEHLSNRNHWVTTCFMIFKIVSIILIEIYIVISSLISISYQSDVFDPVHEYYEDCLENETIKKKFKKDYEYCWGIESKLNVFYTFAFLFVFVDIISIVIVTLSKNYNVWSFILNKISRGKYEYEEIDINKGFIVPQASVVKDDETPEEDLIGAINEADDDLQ